MKVVERANQKAYENQDIVKAFKTKLLLSDVLAERDIQKDHKQRKSDHEKRL